VRGDEYMNKIPALLAARAAVDVARRRTTGTRRRRCRDYAGPGGPPKSRLPALFSAKARLGQTRRFCSRPPPSLLTHDRKAAFLKEEKVLALAHRRLPALPPSHRDRGTSAGHDEDRQACLKNITKHCRRRLGRSARLPRPRHGQKCGDDAIDRRKVRSSAASIFLARLCAFNRLPRNRRPLTIGIGCLSSADARLGKIRGTAFPG